jgi:hypothetical protein
MSSPPSLLSKRLSESGDGFCAAPFLLRSAGGRRRCPVRPFASKTSNLPVMWSLPRPGLKGHLLKGHVEVGRDAARRVYKSSSLSLLLTLSPLSNNFIVLLLKKTGNTQISSAPSLLPKDSYTTTPCSPAPLALKQQAMRRMSLSPSLARSHSR